MKVLGVLLIIFMVFAVSLILYNNTHVASSLAAEKLGLKAVKKGDVSLCDNLKISIFDITNNEESLKLNCAKKAAIGLRDPTACKIVPGNWKFYCYKDVAIALDDQSQFDL